MPPREKISPATRRPDGRGVAHILSPISILESKISAPIRHPPFYSAEQNCGAQVGRLLRAVLAQVRVHATSESLFCVAGLATFPRKNFSYDDVGRRYLTTRAKSGLIYLRKGMDFIPL